MIEKSPLIQEDDLAKALLKSPSGKLASLIDKINENYEYWDTVKYKKAPGYTSFDVWTYVKASRLKMQIKVWDKYNIKFSLTPEMQKICHEFDLKCGMSWNPNTIIPADFKEQFMVSTIMEEAISSSQMEGAVTTRQVAKEILRKEMQPKDVSQQMIVNNYHAIQFITENKDAPLSANLILQLHRIMTENTLNNSLGVGAFRNNDNVVVENGITHEIIHVPPSYTEIPDFIKELCTFFNDKETDRFIHPVIRAIIIHYMLAYIHPFVDGNGRTARALFYWYMIKQNYWLTEYLSISRIISRSKKSYEKAYQYSEIDGMDIGYFVTYHLKVIEQAYKELLLYIEKKQNEKRAANTFLLLGDINERQAQVIQMFTENPQCVITVKDLQVKFMITPTTAKNDIIGLLDRGLLREISFNKVKKGYIKGDMFDDVVKAVLNGKN